MKKLSVFEKVVVGVNAAAIGACGVSAIANIGENNSVALGLGIITIGSAVYLAPLLKSGKSNKKDNDNINSL